MSKKLLSFFATILAFAISASFAFAQNGTTEGGEKSGDGDKKPGITVIVGISGSAEVFEAEGQPGKPAVKDMIIPVGASLVTGPGCTVDLAMSNGALFQIQENSQFAIGEFEQESYQFVFNNGATLKAPAVRQFDGGEAALTQLDASAEAFNDLEAEPTSSTAKFSLGYGTLVAYSKRLAPGSAMEVATPVGVAGIRGTILRLTVLRVGPPGSNQFSVRLDVPQGTVQFGNSDGTRAVTVNRGFTLQAVGFVQTPGQVRIDQLSNTPMSAEAAALLANIVNQVRQVQTTFTAIQGSPEILNRVQVANQATQQTATGDAGVSAPVTIDPPDPIPQPFVPGGGGAIPVPPTPTPTPTPPPSLP
jgi:hypothetical protein